MRTRFPPSPTGLLHVGGLRTALYCYLLVQKHGGNFILRIEDTDRERYVPEAVHDFIDSLHWAGADPDEGVMRINGSIDQKGDKGPYVQSERLPMYKQYADQLIESGHAYYAFDTPEEIEAMREAQRANGNPAPKYDASVRMRMQNSLALTPEEVQERLDRGDPYVLRLNVDPNRDVECNDIIRGKTVIKGYTIDDQVLLKSDGYPTYHLANVIDDHFMEIDYVLRGEEWLPSLPKHILLYEGFGWELPTFAHVSLMLNKDGGKLSKRHNDVSVRDYIERGYLPEALVNFIALVGWNPGSTQEIFSMEELIQEFSVERIQKSGAVFDREKLDWIQGQWMRRFSLEEFVSRIRPLVEEAYPDSQHDNQFEAKAALIQERITFLHEAPEMLSYYYTEPVFNIEIAANKKQKVTADMLPDIVALLIETLEPLADSQWNDVSLKDMLFAVCEEKELKRGQLLWPLRAILTGLPYSPGAFEVAAVLGKEKTMERLERAKNAL